MDRRTLLVIELDQGYTVTLGDQILAVESLDGVAHAISFLLGPSPAAEEIHRPVRVLPDSSILPVDFDPMEEEPLSPEAERLAPQRRNLTRLVKAYLQMEIDYDEFTDGLSSYCPDLETDEVNAQLTAAQGLAIQMEPVA